MKRILLIAACSIAAASALAAPPDGPAARAAVLDGIFARLDTDAAPGCSVGVFENGKTLIQRNYGAADIATRAPLTGDTIFYMASVSKQFTSLAAVKLVEDGKLRLEDDIRRWLPELPDYGTAITVSMLMHHTSGVRDVLDLFSLAGTDRYEKLMPADALRMLVRQQGVDFTPGSRYSYSNGGYFLLAQVVERASGEPFHEFARKRILEPLGMRSSFFRYGPNPPGRRIAHGYVRTEAGSFEVRDTYPGFSGSGGLMSSVNDMAKYDRDFHFGHRVWTARTRELMLAPGRLSSGVPIDATQGLGYASGLRVGTLRGQPWVEHSGGHAAFRSNYALQPKLRSGAIVICNRTDGDDSPSDYVFRMVEAFHGDALSGAWPPPRSRATSATAEEATQPVSAALAAALGAGTARYRSAELEATYAFEQAGDTLAARVFSVYSNGERLETIGSLRMVSPDVLRSDAATVRLERAADGSITAFVLDRMRSTKGLRFVRVAPHGARSP